jgi:hypothetical protein
MKPEFPAPALDVPAEGGVVQGGAINGVRYGGHARMITPMTELPYNLFRAAQVREMDRIAIEEVGIPGRTLMERAGGAVFQALRAQWPELSRLAVVCGLGNNGGDGYVVARLAREAGLQVTALQLGDQNKVRGDALEVLDGRRGCNRSRSMPTSCRNRT